MSSNLNDLTGLFRAGTVNLGGASPDVDPAKKKG